jgi:hypothetical protein
MSLALWITGIASLSIGGFGLYLGRGTQGGQGDLVVRSFAAMLLLAAVATGVLWLILLAVKLFR